MSLLLSEVALPLGATWIIFWPGPTPPDVGEGPVEFTESLADITVVDVPDDVIIEDSKQKK